MTIDFKPMHLNLISSLTKAYGFIVFLCLTLGILPWNQAQAQSPYYVDLDICHTGISNEGTGNEITVEFLNRDGEVIGTDKKSGVSENCHGSDATFKCTPKLWNQYPSKIRISTNGDDGLFIDEVYCYQTLPPHEQHFKRRKEVGHYGVDNGTGWCLSTDPNDANGEWAGKCRNGCTRSIVLDFKGPAKATRYSVKIDNCHSDIDNEGTGNKITVEFMNGSEVVKKSEKNGIPVNCIMPDAEFICYTSTKITAVRVSTNGDDGFYIDELAIYKDGDKVKQHGGDNGGGWCLSTDPSDAHGSWKGKCSGTGHSCHRSVTFPLW